MQRLEVTSNAALRVLLKGPQWRSVSEIFVGVNTPQALLRNPIYGFIRRL